MVSAAGAAWEHVGAPGGGAGAGLSRERPRGNLEAVTRPGHGGTGRDQLTLTTLRVVGRVAFHEGSAGSPWGSTPPASTWSRPGRRNARALAVEGLGTFQGTDKIPCPPGAYILMGEIGQ